MLLRFESWAWLCRSCGIFALIAILLGWPSQSLAADQATLIIQPDHGPCNQEVTLTGHGFVPGSTVHVLPLSPAKGQPFHDRPDYIVTPDQTGGFTLRVDPCPRNASVFDGYPVTWQAEPPGRPYYVTNGPFASATFTVSETSTPIPGLPNTGGGGATADPPARMELLAVMAALFALMLGLIAQRHITHRRTEDKD